VLPTADGVIMTGCARGLTYIFPFVFFPEIPAARINETRCGYSNIWFGDVGWLPFPVAWR
jgi:hypothetical protein